MISTTMAKFNPGELDESKDYHRERIRRSKPSKKGSKSKMHDRRKRGRLANRRKGNR